MKNLGIRLLSFMVIVFGSMTAHAACDKEYKFHYTEEYAPYSSVDVDGKVTGIDMDLLRQAIEGTGCPYQGGLIHGLGQY